MSGEQTLKGPDLAAGVDLGDIADGAMLVGHAQGEAVLVVRRGEEHFAIGASCSHYGAPLIDGLLVGEAVHCPWHHARFDVRTGEAIAAPALNALPCWKVEKRGEKLYVLGKSALENPGLGGNPCAHPPVATEAPSSIVIIGAGAAGGAAAEMLRRQGYTRDIALVGADTSGPYDRPNLSKDYLAGKAQEEWIPLRPKAFYAEHKIDLRVSTRVTSIDAKAKRVNFSDGSSIAFGALLLATGADPVRLALPGVDRPHVHYLRSLDDCRAIIETAKNARRAVVLGSSFIGLEVAASLRARKIDVDVVTPDAHPLVRILGPELGDFHRKLHESHGVVFHFGDTAASIDEGSVTLASGTKIDADLVVIGVGVQPNVALAEGAGLALDRGVVVNEYLQTSAPGIYAAGDIARFPDRRSGSLIRVEHWNVAQRQGQIAATNMLGGRRVFDATPFFRTTHYDVKLAYVGHAENWDRIDVSGDIDARSATVAFRKENRTLAVATIGRNKASLEAESALDRDDEAALEKLVPRR